mmetsp:Transcript_125695/g.228073  ORF Transcript_125695/g.228073 Transcript_125695/m.228073 type:complete len:300 (+) Transcript_125695:237-1136(+)
MVEGLDGHVHFFVVAVLHCVLGHHCHLLVNDLPLPFCHARAFEHIFPTIHFIRQVARCEQMGCRAITDNQTIWKVGGLKLLHRLCNFIGNKASHALSEPDRAATVTKAQAMIGHLLNHLIKLRPALPADNPNVNLVFWFQVAPIIEQEASVLTKLWSEQNDTPIWRVLLWADNLSHDIRQGLATGVRDFRYLITAPWTVCLAHRVGVFNEGVVESLITVLSPRAAPAKLIQSIPFTLVLRQPPVCCESVGTPLTLLPPGLVETSQSLLGRLQRQAHLGLLKLCHCNAFRLKSRKKVCTS